MFQDDTLYKLTYLITYMLTYSADMMTTPQLVEHKMVAVATPVA